MRTVLLVPRRVEPERDRLWAWCKARWESILPEVPIYEGHHDEGPFSRSIAVNRASVFADVDGRWDLAIVIDADIFVRLSQVRAAIERAASTGRVTWAHRRWRGMHEDWTKRLVRERRDFGPEIDSEDMDLLVERTNPISWSCCLVIPRAVWDDMGGFDERFAGWGYEDMALQSLIVGLYGHERIDGDVYHLWHARVFGSGRADKQGLAYTPEALTNARLGRRYMVALRRDHGLHDRPGLPSSDEERERDIANLLRDDEKLAEPARRAGLPDWSDWWPTLEELRDGAKERRIEGDHARMTVTVIVHTGGEAETWEERSGYLRRSLASLTEQVTGPIVQKVLYSDWGAERREELTAIGAPFGFYVAGPDAHHGYTPSMQFMWRYLRNRALGTYVFQVEDDFEYLRPVELEPMMETLAAEPKVAQIVLLREACYPREFERGGILGWPEADFERGGSNGTSWLAHRLFWSQNPSLYRRSITDTPWPSGSSSERLFGDALLRDKRLRFALWGSGEAWIRHLGEVRASVAY